MLDSSSVHSAFSSLNLSSSVLVDFPLSKGKHCMFLHLLFWGFILANNKTLSASAVNKRLIKRLQIEIIKQTKMLSLVCAKNINLDFFYFFVFFVFFQRDF